MATLNEGDIIRLLREEYDRKIQEVMDELDVFVNLGKLGKTNVLSPGLKVRENESGLLYTIVAVTPDGCTLQSTEGEEFRVDNSELEKRYELD